MNICLNMIVKNEEHCILECLESVQDHIHYFVICDTGSTDSTIQLIKEWSEKSGIDGVVLEHEWKDFAHNRNKALREAEARDGWADYIFFMDADDIFKGTMPKSFRGDVIELVSDMGDGGFEYTRRHLIKPNTGFYWKGVVHEYLTRDEPYDVEVIDKETCKIHARTIGGRNLDGKEAKWKRDVEALKKGLKEEPDNDRYMFYLAQTYFSLHQWSNAVHWYKKRIKLGGAQEEVAVCKRKMALAKMLNEDSFENCRDAMLDAWEYRPSRAEPLYDLARLCRKYNKPSQGMLFARQCYQTPYPKHDRLFIHSFIWEWAALDELAQASYNVGQYEAAAGMFIELLEKVPKSELERTLYNLKKCCDDGGIKLELGDEDESE